MILRNRLNWLRISPLVSTCTSESTQQITIQQPTCCAHLQGETLYLKKGTVMAWSLPRATNIGITLLSLLLFLSLLLLLTAVGPFQLPAPKSGTLSRISSGTRPSVQTVLDVCLKRTCSLDTSVSSPLDVLDDNCSL